MTTSIEMNLLIVFGSIVLVAIITLLLFRFITRQLGLNQVVNDGVVLTENGLEFLGFLGLGKMKVNYADIESVELLPYYKGLTSILFFRYGISSHWVGTRLFHEIVVINLKGQRVYKHLLSTPKNPSIFVEELNRQIEVRRQPTAL